MKKLMIAAMGALAVAACETPAPANFARSAGSLALSSDASRLLVVDGDNDELVIVDPAAEKAEARVKVGRGATRVILGADGRAYVANRFDRSVSVVDVAAQKELSRIKVGAEPVSLSFDGDGKLVVANHTSRTLSIVDVAKGVEERQLAVGADPTGLKVVGHKAYVAYGRSPALDVIDLSAAQPAPKALSMKLKVEQTGGDERIPGQGLDPVFNPDLNRVYVPHVQSKETPIATDLPDAYAGAGSIPVVANAVATVDTANDEVLPAPTASTAKDCPGCGDIAPPMPGLLLAGTASPDGVPPALTGASGALSGPSSSLLDPSGRWLYVTNLNSNNVQVVGLAPGAASLQPVRVGRGPNGLAISADGKRAYVYNSFDHTVSVLEGQNGEIVATREFVVGQTNLTPEQDLGRKLFFAADDTRMTNPSTGGIACASCHPAGREDGRTWQFSEGPRNTPTLAGRNLKGTAPYHWDGALSDMHAFNVVVEARMGGTQGALSTSDFNAMLAYLDTLPGPDNAKKGTLDAAQVARGKALFEGSTGCASCHSGPDLTDNDFHDVGTIGLTADGSRERFAYGVNTPPLHDLFDSAPYLHDGSLKTLRDRITNNPNDQHGKTSHLSQAEIDDLVAYLETL